MAEAGARSERTGPSVFALAFNAASHADLASLRMGRRAAGRVQAQADIEIAPWKARQWAEIERFKVGLKAQLHAVSTGAADPERSRGASSREITASSRHRKPNAGWSGLGAQWPPA